MKNNGWTCLPWSFALVAGYPVDVFIDKIGHDGSAEPYRDLPGVKRGFHQQECIEVMQALGFACTPIELVPQIQPAPDGPTQQIWFPGEGVREQCNSDRFFRHLKGTKGVLTGVTIKDNNEPDVGHATAWNGFSQLISDDRKDVPPFYTLNDILKYKFGPQVYWKVQRISDA